MRGRSFGAKNEPQDDNIILADIEQQVPRRRRRCRSSLLGMTNVIGAARFLEGWAGTEMSGVVALDGRADSSCLAALARRNDKELEWGANSESKSRSRSKATDRSVRSTRASYFDRVERDSRNRASNDPLLSAWPTLFLIT